MLPFISSLSCVFASGFAIENDFKFKVTYKEME